MTKFIAIIPARYASTRFPGKPLAIIDGVTMIERVYRRVSECFKYVYVATDDARIEAAVTGFGGEVVLTSNSHRSGTDRCAEALIKVECQTGERFDVVINVQGDEPFVSKEQLTKIQFPFSKPSTQIATLIKEFTAEEDIFNPNSPKVVIDNDNNALYFSRSVVPYIRGKELKDWQGSSPFFKHIGLYAYRADVLREITKLPMGILEAAESLEQLRWLENGYKITTEKTTSESIAIDTPEDLEILLKKMSSI